MPQLTKHFHCSCIMVSFKTVTNSLDQSWFAANQPLSMTQLWCIVYSLASAVIDWFLSYTS